MFTVPTAAQEELFGPSIYSTRVVACLSDSAIDFVRTWETLSSSVDAMENNERIPEEIREVLRMNYDGLGDRTFLQNYLQRFVTFGNSDEIDNAVDAVSPSVTVGRIEEALSHITTAVQNGDRVELWRTLASIGQVGNYEPPSAEELGEGGMTHLGEAMGSHNGEDCKKVVVFERELDRAMKGACDKDYHTRGSLQVPPCPQMPLSAPEELLWPH